MGARSLRCHANGFTTRPIIPLGGGLLIVAIGIAWPFILAVCVGIEESAVARLLDHCLAMSDVEGVRELHISTEHNESSEVRVAVRDSGPGVRAGNLPHLFSAFYTTKPGGMGMGLSISRSIIEAHNGQLWASANLPRGASFQFALPTIANTAS